jgi:hypothetical protein
MYAIKLVKMSKISPAKSISRFFMFYALYTGYFIIYYIYILNIIHILHTNKYNSKLQIAVYYISTAYLLPYTAYLGVFWSASTDPEAGKFQIGGSLKKK